MSEQKTITRIKKREVHWGLALLFVFLLGIIVGAAIQASYLLGVCSAKVCGF